MRLKQLVEDDERLERVNRFWKQKLAQDVMQAKHKLAGQISYDIDETMLALSSSQNTPPNIPMATRRLQRIKDYLTSILNDQTPKVD